MTRIFKNKLTKMYFLHIMGNSMLLFRMEVLSQIAHIVFLLILITKYGEKEVKDDENDIPAKKETAF